MRSFRLPALLLVAWLISPVPAFADATAFLGSSTSPANRPARGFAFGMGLLVVGFEFEYADTRQDVSEGSPSLKTGMGNLLLQTPVPIAGMQFYVTTGAGGYRESLGTHQETHIGVNTGGGVKVNLIGPVRARLDYRIFNLRGAPLESTVHRLYAGVNLKF